MYEWPNKINFKVFSGNTIIMVWYPTATTTNATPFDSIIRLGGGGRWEGRGAYCKLRQ